MEYHYSDLCMPSEHLMTDSHYATEYVAPYRMPGQREAEYETRNTVLVDGGDRFGVSAVVFDKNEELIWMGNQGGHVTSYYGPTMQKYTSFQVHESEEVRDIVTHESGIFALTKTSLRHQIRRGLPKHTFKSPNMTDMQCLYQASPTNLMMGGHQDKLIDLDITKMVETVIPIPEEGCAVLRSGGGSTVACGSARGSVCLRDLRCPGAAEHSFRAHTACLSDLDMQGDLLITAGFTHDTNGAAVAEPYVVVWDVRRLRGGASGGAWRHTPSPPLLLHFLPAFSGRAVAVAGDGHAAILRVNQEDYEVFQVDTQSSLCTVMDVSSSSQALVFGDQAGHLHLFSPQHNTDPVFNTFSRETEFADQAPNHPFAGFNDTTFQYSSIPLPPLTTSNKWFNELPEEFFKKIYRKPRPIDPEVLKTMKMQGPIGYAPNPRTRRRNEIPYVEDTLEDLNAAKNNDVRLYCQPIPKHYQKADPRFPKQGPTDPDVENHNKTGFPTLEATLPNSYCNPMLQVLYYTRPVKATLLAHTCAKEFCLSCELGFLFRMLDTSGGAPCQATNFLRAFRTVPEAAALGLILPERGPDPRVDLVALIQSWNRFILHQMHYEILETRKKEKELIRAQNANSPPKAQVGNATLNHTGSVATPHMNGNVEEYNCSELEFLGPTEFDNSPVEGKEDGWPLTNGPSTEEAALNTPEPSDNCDNIELPIRQADREESDISQLFAIGRHQLNRCLKCNKEEERESVALACLLQYPLTPGRCCFATLLQNALSSRRNTPAWCEQCRRFSPTAQATRVTRLPPILSINCGGVTAHEKAYWSRGAQKEMPEGVKRGGSQKPCRYGLHCARPGCRFKHPDRPGSSSQSPTANMSPTRESNCVLPTSLTIRLSADGEIVINDKCEDNPEPHQSPSKTDSSSRKKPVITEAEEEYLLSAAVVCVEENPKHLVAYVQTQADGETSWFMINDLSIYPVTIDEAVQCAWWWKTPSVLFYTSRALTRC
ncbi:PAN2-PAN3 deadenylation complex catalytic subunit PAN2 [Plutella xylostella]|uniref:PAN2-PAN3 deadenylation complex catalytic subunit PAN2 n=1 Tax=Plutella xylostella TaxID=51655 RepID=UPI0020330082|nr:PAN2-PAN3 deadenylation complex catalytic subunit PAN2 [Plutella xylostella]